jgi:putative FmdB family regulatory protein
MPTYSYRCNECGHEFQARQRMTDDPLTECPVCQGRVRRVVSSVGVVFKGSGFYVTDNRSGGANGKSSKPKPKDGEKAATDSAAPTGTSSETGSKPAPTPATSD